MLSRSIETNARCRFLKVKVRNLMLADGRPQMTEWRDARGQISTHWDGTEIRSQNEVRIGGKVECRAAREASRRQGDCITGAGWNAMPGDLGTEG